MLYRMLTFFATSVVMTPTALAEVGAAHVQPDAPVAAPAPAPEAGITRPAEAVPSSGHQKGASGASGPANAGALPTPPPVVESGIASVYASDLEGRPTASGALYDSQKLTAAHRSLPLGSRIRITDAASGKSVSVTVNDRWSGGPGQIVNLSRRAADEVGLRGNGQRKVEVTVEALGDGRRQPGFAGSTARLLPERIEATANDSTGRTRSCANEADILGLKDALWESHVRNCLGRKAKRGATTIEAKAR